MITVHNLSKHYGAQEIFNNVTFTVNAGERVGLVGRNGHGKTTLFRIISGEEECDDGEVIIPNNYRIGYLSQHIAFTQDSIIAEGCMGLREEERDAQWKVSRILTGLGFSESDFARHPSEFSGGFHVRLALAKVLASEPDLLLLDEPTNFLDIVSIRWLEKFLCAWRGECIIISHDRTFMDRVTDTIIGIHRKKLKKTVGNTNAYYANLAMQEEVYEKERMNDEKRIKDMQRFIGKFRAKARQAGLVQSRIKTLEKMEKKDKLASMSSLSFSFNYHAFPGKDVLRARELSFSYEGSEPYLINTVSVDIKSHDKVCIVGKNGAGKTTLLKLIARELAPCGGELKYHPKIESAYFEQANTAYLAPERTVEEEIASSSSHETHGAIRSVCGAMMFSGDASQKKIRVLSGGEKCRVMLGKILVSPSNVLFLDEPTHHLDMSSCDAMIHAVKRYKGAAVIVTHDENFLRNVANKLIVFKDDRVIVFPGTYDAFLDQIGWGDSDDGAKQPEKKKATSKKEDRKARAQLVAERSKALTPLVKKIESLEKTIEKEEKSLAQATEAMVVAAESGDVEKITQVSKAMKEHEQAIDEHFNALQEVTERYEDMKKLFCEKE